MGEQQYVSGEVIIQWREGVPEQARSRIKQKHGLKKEHATGPHWKRDGITHHHGIAHGRERETAVQIMRENPEDVVWAEPNGIMTVEPVEGSASFVASDGDWWVGQVGALIAAAGIAKLPEIRVGILDSGYRHAEPFFSGCVPIEKNFVLSLASDGTPIISTEDHEGHGTATLAIELEILKLFTAKPGVHVGRVMSSNSASWSNVSQGVLWLLDLVPLVPAIGCSIGGSSNSFSLTDAALKAQDKGVAWICAAGNSSSTTPAYPAATKGAYAIAATKENDQRASFTNTGDWITAAFPGTNFRCPKLDGSDGLFNGTSASAPGFAACVAVLAAHFKISGVEAVKRIVDSCKKLPDAGLGAGRADMAGALGVASPEPVPDPTPVPDPPPPQPPPPTTVPAIPGIPRVSELTPTSFRISWDAVEGATSYEVYRGDYRFQSTKAPNTTVVFPWGSPDSDYKIRVLAGNASGNSPLSAPLFVHTPSVGDPVPPPPPPPPPAITLPANITADLTDIKKTIPVLTAEQIQLLKTELQTIVSQL